MPLSARLVRRRPVRAIAVGLPRRLLSSALDGLLPSVGLWVMLRFDAIRLGSLRAPSGVLQMDWLLLELYRNPWTFLNVALMWMLLWSAVALIGLGTVRVTAGKWLVGLSIRQSSGDVASGARMLRRIVASWLVPLTLGLGYLWIAVSSDRRGWHDVLSGTWVVRERRDRNNSDAVSSRRDRP